MDTKLFKKLIKEAVKEAIQEEMKEILLEAIKAPRTPISVGGYGTVAESIDPYTQSTQTLKQPITSTPDIKNKYRELLGEMMEAKNKSISMTSNDAFTFGQQSSYRPPLTANTTSEGSSLPAGEVNLDQIMGLMNKK